MSLAVAAGVLYPIAGLFLSQVLAGAAMASGSVSVVPNSVRLKRFRLPAVTGAPGEPRLRQPTAKGAVEYR